MAMSLNTSVYTTFPSAGVIQLPVNTTVPAGKNVTFTCRVDAPDASWKINGSYWFQLPHAVLLDIHEDRTEKGNFTYKLIFFTREEYNATKVQCVAVSESERKDGEPPAYLYIG